MTLPMGASPPSGTTVIEDDAGGTASPPSETTVIEDDAGRDGVLAVRNNGHRGRCGEGRRPRRPKRGSSGTMTLPMGASPPSARTVIEDDAWRDGVLAVRYNGHRGRCGRDGVLAVRNNGHRGRCGRDGVLAVRNVGHRGRCPSQLHVLAHIEQARLNPAAADHRPTILTGSQQSGRLSCPETTSLTQAS